jgi:CheY-like chemotaxis protein
MTNTGGLGAIMAQRPKAILCLSDDRGILRVRRMLLEHFGYVVLPTTSAKDAKSIVQQQCPDMLLMDNGDEGVDYAHLAKEVKDICPEVITVVLSPYYCMSSSTSAGHVDRFVPKDEGPDALISHIKELFGGVQAENSAEQ